LRVLKQQETRKEGGAMGIRMRALLKVVGCALAGAGLFWLWSLLLAPTARPGQGGMVKWLLALPVVGMGIGLVELATGLPIQQAETAWQAAPALVKYPAALVGGVLFLWGFLWLVFKALGA
jgi:hypothetical protein